MASPACAEFSCLFSSSVSSQTIQTTSTTTTILRGCGEYGDHHRAVPTRVFLCRSFDGPPSSSLPVLRRAKARTQQPRRQRRPFQFCDFLSASSKRMTTTKQKTPQYLTTTKAHPLLLFSLSSSSSLCSPLLCVCQSLVTTCVCVYFFVGEFYSPRQSKEREMKKKCLGF